MKFDAVIIGGGLAGLTCGIKLSKQQKKCLIISSGQSALHFSSGSFDLLNLVNENEVRCPADEIGKLINTTPEHPYAKIGKEKFESYAGEAKKILIEAGIEVAGSAGKNHFRVTPLGFLRPTWLTIKDFATSEERSKLPWKKVSIFNITGFLDFHPEFIADEFKKMGVDSEIFLIDLPELKTLRKNLSELRATNIARLFDREDYLHHLSEIIKKRTGNSDTLILPACLGLKSNTLDKLSQKVGKPIKLIPTFPPSIAGIRSQQLLMRYFEKLGGIYMLGDTVKSVDITADYTATRVYTENHADIPFEARAVVLATGSYFSQGLIASSSRIFEPVMNLDVDYQSHREEWTAENFFDKQNYQHFGVKTTNKFNAFKEGKPINNLYAIGAILNGSNTLKEGCGSGVSMLTAIAVADNILNS